MGNLFNYVDELGNIIPALVNRGTRAQNVRRILDVNNIPAGPSLDGLDFPFGARGIPSVDPVSVAEEVVVPDIDYGTLLRGMGMDRSRPNLGGSPPNMGGGLVPVSPTSRATFSNDVIDVDAVEILNQISSSRGRPIPGGGLASSPNVRQTFGGGGGGRSGPPPNNTLQAPAPGGRGVGLNTIYEDYRGLPGWALPAAVGGSIAAGYGYSQLPLGNDQEQPDKPSSSPTPKATSNSLPPSSSPTPKATSNSLPPSSSPPPSSGSTSNAIPSPSKEGTVRYKIKKGDTLWGMTQDWDEINAIAKANNISDPNKIYAEAYINLTPEQDLLRRTLAKSR